MVRIGVGRNKQHARGVAVELGQVAAVAAAGVLRAVAVQPVRNVAVGVQAVQDGVRVPARVRVSACTCAANPTIIPMRSAAALPSRAIPGVLGGWGWRARPHACA